MWKIKKTKMFCLQTFNYFSALVCVLLFDVSQACFRNNEHGSTSLATGSPYYKECQCSEPGYTMKDLIWLGIDGKPIETRPGTDSDVYTEEQSDGINLHISKISKTMSGTYKCITIVDGVIYAQAYTIDVYDPLYFFATPNDQFLIEKQDSPLVCRAHGESDLLIRWQKKIDFSFVEIINDDKYSIESDGLRVRNVSTNDAGIYKCIAQGITTGEELDTVINVEVATVPEIVEIRATPGPTVVVGSYLSIDCLAVGTPNPNYTWEKIENETKSNNVNWKQKVNSIIFEKIGPDDRGIYQCVVYNSAGSNVMDIFVEVLVPPEIFDFPNITILEGELTQIFCNASGNSEPNITLAFLGHDIDNIVVETLEDKEIPDGSLILAHRSDEGFYICNASNEVDYTLSKMYMTVLRPPQFEEPNELIWGWDGKTVGLSCIHDSKPKAKIIWRFDSNELATSEQVEYNKMLLELLNTVPENYLTISLNKNSSYGIYSCTAKNEYGEATKNITLKQGFRPSAVDNVTILDITPTTAMFYLTAAKFEGPPVLGFIAQYDEAENYNITDIHVNRTWSIDRPYKLEKLKPDTLYYVSFAAINEVGEGEWTENFEFVTLGKAVPEAPILESESITFTSDSNNLLLKWEAPEDNGDPIDYYTIRYCAINATEAQDIVSNELNSEESDLTTEEKCKAKKVVSTTKTEIKNLKENTTYLLELIAHNAKGNSNAVNISVTISAPENIESARSLSGGTIIGLSIVIVLICLVMFDLLLLVWRRQGVIASLCVKKKKKTENTLNSRDKKGLLNRESTVDNRHNGHKEFEYNKSTGTITGKHSVV